MKEIDCEEVLIQKMAEMDGESISDFSIRTESHLAGCEICRSAFRQISEIDEILKKPVRRLENSYLWPEIVAKLEADRETNIESRPFWLIGLSLTGFKLTDLFPAFEVGLALNLIPIILVVAFFAMLKENPFSIDPQIKQEA